MKHTFFIKLHEELENAKLSKRLKELSKLADENNNVHNIISSYSSAYQAIADDTSHYQPEFLQVSSSFSL